MLERWLGKLSDKFGEWIHPPEYYVDQTLFTSQRINQVPLRIHRFENVSFPRHAELFRITLKYSDKPTIYKWFVAYQNPHSGNTTVFGLVNEYDQSKPTLYLGERKPSVYKIASLCFDKQDITNYFLRTVSEPYQVIFDQIDFGEPLFHEEAEQLLLPQRAIA